MNRGVEIDSDVADLPAGADRGTGHERHRDPDVAAVPLARRRRRGGPRWLTVLFAGARVIDPSTGVDEVDRRPRWPAAGSRPSGTRWTPPAPRRSTGTGLVLAPGLVDLHTHLREPGFEHKETIETGTRAAALGGYTAVSSMANTEPVTDHAGDRRRGQGEGRRRGPGRRVPGGRHHRRAGRGVDRRDGGDGRGGRPGVQRRRQLRADRPHVAQRPHVREGLPRGRRDRRPLRGPFPGRGRAHARRASTRTRSGSPGARPRPRRSIVARDIAMARMTGGRLHVCHLSSARSVDLVRRRQGRGRSCHR